LGDKKILNKEEVAAIIDHSMLRAGISRENIMAGCFEAIKYNFGCVAVLPYNVPLVKRCLESHDIDISAAIAFPVGSWTEDIKNFEAQDAVDRGATEIDYVINIGALKDGDYDYIKREMKAMRQLDKEITIKCIIEVGFLNKGEIVRVCKMAADEGIDYVKTSTGFFKWPTPDIVKLMYSSVKGTQTKIKAAAGMTTAEDARKMIEAGAERLGTSAGVVIVEGWEE
jgi:deoxyribose-phosphate aldolase